MFYLIVLGLYDSIVFADVCTSLFIDFLICDNVPDVLVIALATSLLFYLDLFNTLLRLRISGGSVSSALFWFLRFYSLLMELFLFGFI